MFNFFHQGLNQNYHAAPLITSSDYKSYRKSSLHHKSLPYPPKMTPHVLSMNQPLILWHILRGLQRIVVRKQLIGIIFILECIQSRQLPFSVPS